MAFRLLFVCTGNRCRSPLAEQLMRQAVVDLDLPWIVESAGTLADDGQPIHHEAARLLTGRGIEANGWRSRLLTGPMIDSADLILTAETGHRSAVVAGRPSALHKTFTLRQFALLADAIEPIRSPDSAQLGPELVARAALARNRVQAVKPAAIDVPDPMGGRRRDFARCARLIEESISAVLRPVRSGRQASRTYSPGTSADS